METGLLIIRVVLGVVFVAHGTQKLFGWFGGFGIAGTGGWLASMGFRPARLHATVSGLSELGGGLLLAFGLLTPLGAAAVAGVMIVAIATVHLPNGFFNTPGGYEFNLTLAATALALAFTGPGRYSLDSAFQWSLAGTEWGLAAIAASVVTAGTVLVARTPVPAQFEAAQEESQAA
jgi:putative oxidoreductase